MARTTWQKAGHGVGEDDVLGGHDARRAGGDGPVSPAPAPELAAVGDPLGEVMSAVQLPLENAEYALDQYLLAHGQRLDTETRMLLAGVRDCIGRVAVSARRLARHGPTDAATRRVVGAA